MPRICRIFKILSERHLRCIIQSVVCNCADKAGILNPGNAGVIDNIQFIMQQLFSFFFGRLLHVFVRDLTELYNVIAWPRTFSNYKNVAVFFQMVDCRSCMVNDERLSIDKTIAVVLNGIHRFIRQIYHDQIKRNTVFLCKCQRLCDIYICC